ncbi:MAG TPA: hypothetical protein VFQ38_23815 [Longimicrobiales bacterium]|nr:hypothetical protein [Longimicrobiales bacterium]
MTRRVVAAALVVGLGLGGCAGAAGAGVAEDALAASQAGVVRVRVENHNWLDVNVYAVHNGTRYRLGTVTSMTGHTFQLPISMLAQTGEFRLLVDPIGSSEVFLTEPLLVSPGQQIDWSVENHLALSSYRIF